VDAHYPFVPVDYSEAFSVLENTLHTIGLIGKVALSMLFACVRAISIQLQTRGRNSEWKEESVHLHFCKTPRSFALLRMTVYLDLDYI
jgi:hypothetical protein